MGRRVWKCKVQGKCLLSHSEEPLIIIQQLLFLWRSPVTVLVEVQQEFHPGPKVALMFLCCALALQLTWFSCYYDVALCFSVGHEKKRIFSLFFWSYITSVFREVALTGTHVTPHLLFPWEVLFCMPIVLLVGRKWSASYSEDESALIFYERRGLGYKGNKTQGRISPMLSQSNFQAKSPKTTLLG